MVLSLLSIPVILTIICYFLYRDKWTWWELPLPTVVTALVVWLTQYTMDKVQTWDVEYTGSLIMRAEYTEAWETWVHRTCTRRVGKVTTTYDCSYCNHHPAIYTAYDNLGNSFGISRAHYEALVAKWGNNKRVELNRAINYSGSCGQDGDMYITTWNISMATAESAVRKHSFTNYLKRNHSVFNFPEITDEKAAALKIYPYPEFHDDYKQTCILSNYIKFSESTHNTFQYLNGTLGPKHRVKVFYCIFKDADINKASYQEAYWEGGNENEIVICMSMDANKKFQWVKVFSWTDNKRVAVELRENIMNLKQWNDLQMYTITESAIKNYYHYKDFEDFSYLKFEPTTGQIWLTVIISIIVTIATTYFAVKNPHTK